MHAPASDAENADLQELLEAQTFIRDLLPGIAARILALRESGTMKMEEKRQAETDGKKFDLVTEADKLSERLIVEALRERYPDDEIAGEEQGAQGTKTGRRRWEIDPIDGTYNFSRGDECGISVGLLQDDEPVMGVVHFLHDDTQMYGTKGAGAYLRDGKTGQETRLHIMPDSSTHTLSQAHMSWDIGHGDLQEQMKLFTALRPHTRYITSHACYLVAVRRVLENKRDAYVNTGAKAYDMAASVVIAREAGAAVSGIREDALRFTREDRVMPSIIARNGDILRQIKETLGID